MQVHKGCGGEVVVLNGQAYSWVCRVCKRPVDPAEVAREEVETPVLGLPEKKAMCQDFKLKF